MQRRLLVVLIVAVVLIVPAVIILFVVDRSPSLQNSVLQLTNQPIDQSTNTTIVSNPPTNAATNPDRAAMTYAARNFAETYGSGTNQNNLAHYEQAKQWGTKDFNKFLDRLIAQERTLPTTPYRGTVSSALVVSVTRQTPAVASVTMTLQRHETVEATSRSYTQELYLDLVKQGNDWKVNAASWQAL